jgi:hypothetical protein
LRQRRQAKDRSNQANSNGSSVQHWLSPKYSGVIQHRDYTATRSEPGAGTQAPACFHQAIASPKSTPEACVSIHELPVVPNGSRMICIDNQSKFRGSRGTQDRG